MNLIRTTALALLIGTSAVSSSAMTAPQPQRAGTITYVSGGVGLDEAAAMKRLAPQYPLRVVIAEKGGAYNVAQRMVVERDGRELAQIDDAGPWLLLDLPAGRYTLRGLIDGRWQQRSVHLGAGGLTLHWLAPGND